MAACFCSNHPGAPRSAPPAGPRPGWSEPAARGQAASALCSQSQNARRLAWQSAERLSPLHATNRACHLPRPPPLSRTEHVVHGGLSCSGPVQQLQALPAVQDQIDLCDAILWAHAGGCRRARWEPGRRIWSWQGLSRPDHRAPPGPGFLRVADGSHALRFVDFELSMRLKESLMCLSRCWSGAGIGARGDPAAQGAGHGLGLARRVAASNLHASHAQ